MFFSQYVVPPQLFRITLVYFLKASVFKISFIFPLGSVLESQSTKEMFLSEFA